MSRVLAWTALVLLVIATAAIYAAPAAERPQTIQSAVLLIAIVVALEGIAWLAIVQTLGFATLITAIVGGLLGYILVMPQTAAQEATVFQALVLVAVGGYGLALIGGALRLVDRVPRRGPFNAPTTHVRRAPSPFLARESPYAGRPTAPRIVPMERLPEHDVFPGDAQPVRTWANPASRWGERDHGQWYATRPQTEQRTSQSGARR